LPTAPGLVYFDQPLTTYISELSLEIDLSEHPIYKFPRAFLENPSMHRKFENILRYVHFPEVHLEDLSKEANPGKEVEHIPKKQGQRKSYDSNNKGTGREDLKVIFDWLRNRCKVKKIIKVRVDDNKSPSHSNQTIEESLKDFKVEILDWFKFDLCSETILEAAPDVKEVYLYSSGNNAVLRAWSGCDGLKKLSKVVSPQVGSTFNIKTYADYEPKLKTVHIVIYQVHSRRTLTLSLD